MKMVKSEILRTVATFERANNLIEKNVDKLAASKVLDALVQCQQSALVMGNQLESMEGHTDSIIKLLEEYCEDLYQMSVAVSDVSSCRKLNRKVRKLLEDLRRMIDQEIVQGRKEAVFLPYKASMWDSLESVWKAAVADPDYDTYVIPIPYYDKNPDGSFRELHYEGDCYPDYVPVTDYKAYDFAGRRPDIIFIHNPYDETNYVTSVHPFFYSKNLKQFTDLLVYIPYFVVAEERVWNSGCIRHFCMVPGVFHADKVILQSEFIRNTYIDVLMDELKTPGGARAYLEKKILGIGSPKFDRIYAECRDDSKLPEEWKKKMYRSTGERRTVVFYNTSVGTLISKPGIIQKIEQFYNMVKDDENLLLWWRPHPLYSATISSMHPELMEKYQEFVRRFQTEGRGIYDSGVDLDWAIAESDVYYGDESSITALFVKAGKPVMIQSTECCCKGQKSKSERIRVWPSDFCVDQNSIWFVYGKMNGLMKYDMSTGLTSIAGVIPGEAAAQSSLYSCIYKVRSMLFLIPCWGKNVVVYDIETEKFKEILLRDTDSKQGMLFCKTFYCDQNLYCIPYYYAFIVKINVVTLDVDYISYKEDLEEKLHKSNLYINDAAAVYDGCFAAVLPDTNVVAVYDMQKNMWDILESQEADNQFDSVAVNENLYYLHEATNNELYIMMAEGNTLRLKNRVKLAGNAVLTNINGNIIADYRDKEGCCVINANGNIVAEDKGTSKRKQSDLNYHFFFGRGKVFGDIFYYFSYEKNKMYLIANSCCEEELEFTLTEEQIYNYREKLPFHHEPLIAENKIYSFEYWIEKVINSKMPGKQQAVLSETIQDCGCSIWDAVTAGEEQ